ncbi:hypothetical protein C4D60_Mb04t19910 [Musa balbisiana]|uniref:Uncharacterized protein n=1 Tax=Musa balbisiana TaxID=52838 RepID=A0A4S8KDC3_MUSBA|nr:hypothetical protein C4D60_Mb04t19910 [Musa balbisiana]
MESTRVRRRHGFMMKEAIILCCGFIFLFSLFDVLSSSSYRRSVRLGVRSLMATDPHSQPGQQRSGGKEDAGGGAGVVWGVCAQCGCAGRTPEDTVFRAPCGGGREAEEACRRTGVVPATVYGQVRRLHPVLPGARGCAARHSGDHRVLPRGVAVQMRQQTLHALTPSSPWSPDQPKDLRGTLSSPSHCFRRCCILGREYARLILLGGLE